MERRAAKKKKMEQSFNEAGALLPRKFEQVEQEEERRKGASMRPGHYCPGNRILRSPCEAWLISTRFERSTLLSPSVPEPLLKDPHRVWVSPYHIREKRDARTAHHFGVTKALAGGSAHRSLDNCRPSGRHFITLAQTLDMGINSVGKAQVKD